MVSSIESTPVNKKPPANSTPATAFILAFLHAHVHVETPKPLSLSPRRHLQLPPAACFQQQLMAAMLATERSKVQRLYDACGIIFSSSPTKALPTLRQLRWLQTILDAMEPIDVGIDGSGDERSPESSHGLILGHSVRDITYVHIHECQDFSIGVFCLPAGARLPLHDHPNMVVLTKVLYGCISVQSYDWVNSPSSNPRRSGLARTVADGCTLQSSSKVSVLFPNRGGNIHAITALSPCAILDVLAPPYSEEQGRSSNYYVSTPVASLPGFWILEETGVPDDLHVIGTPYLGPELSFDLDTESNY